MVATKFPQIDLEKNTTSVSYKAFVCFERYDHSVARLTNLQLEVNPLAFVSNLVYVLHKAWHPFRRHGLVKMTIVKTCRYAIDDVLIQKVHHHRALQRLLSSTKLPLGDELAS